MAAFARWTHLSETTYLLAPTDAAADYRVRIFTPGGELPFAGHPTLGSCHAWLAAGGVPHDSRVVVQQCEVGLVQVRRDGARLEFAAPPLRRTGPLEPAVLHQIIKALRLTSSDIRHHQWVDNGPGWCAVMLSSASQVLSLQPDWAVLHPLKLGVVGPHPPSHEAAFEVRAFIGPGLRRSGHRESECQSGAMAHWCRTFAIGVRRRTRHRDAASGSRSLAKEWQRSLGRRRCRRLHRR